MKLWMKCAALAAAASVAVQPCLAAPLGGAGRFAGAHVGAFAGGSFVLPLGGGRQARPSARLRISPVTAFVDTRSGAIVERQGQGLELGLTGAGHADLRLAGGRPAALKRQLGFKGSTGYIVVGGVVVLVLLLAAFAAASPKPGPRKGDF
jgi:hypothetical protein